MKIFRKVGDIRHGWNGLKIVWKEEWHFPYQVTAAAGTLTVAFLLDAAGFELLLLFILLMFALASEVINTVVEDICNKIQPAFDEDIGKIKDMSQTFVILSSLPAVAAFLWIVVPRLA